MGIFVLAMTGVLAGGAAPICDNDGTADIEITVRNTWQAPYAQQILDLSSQGGILYFRSNLDGKIFSVDPEDGSYIGELAIPDSCRSGFGLAVLGDGLYINCDTSPYIYRNPGSGSWESYANPSGTAGGALSNNPWQWNTIVEGYSWSSDRGIFSFESDGSGSQYYALPDIWGTVTGIAAHEVATLGGGASNPYALVVTSRDQHEFFFFWSAGSSYYKYAQEPCPITVQQSLGLAFDFTRSHFFWSYIGADGEYYVSELEIPVLGALDGATWAEVKSSFAE